VSAESGRLGAGRRPAASDGAVSALVLRRFGWRCALFTAWAALGALFGLGFARQLGVMFMIAALVTQLLGLSYRDRLDARHWTHYDETAWFILLGSALRSVG
jgi:hypothetical protein